MCMVLYQRIVAIGWSGLLLLDSVVSGGRVGIFGTSLCMWRVKHCFCDLDATPMCEY